MLEDLYRLPVYYQHLPANEGELVELIELIHKGVVFFNASSLIHKYLKFLELIQNGLELITRVSQGLGHLLKDLFLRLVNAVLCHILAYNTQDPCRERPRTIS